MSLSNKEHFIKYIYMMQQISILIMIYKYILIDKWIYGCSAALSH